MAFTRNTGSAKAASSRFPLGRGLFGDLGTIGIPVSSLKACSALRLGDACRLRISWAGSAEGQADQKRRPDRCPFAHGLLHARRTRQTTAASPVFAFRPSEPEHQGGLAHALRTSCAGEPSHDVPAGSVSPFMTTERSPSWASSPISAS